MANVHDVAAYILAKTGNLSTMKLQKLCYYAQGWHLAWQNTPLFPEPLEAWKMGPVSRDLYQLHKGEATVSSWPRGDAENLNQSEQATLNGVIDFYKPFSGFDLGEMTHQERPWIEAWQDAAPTARGRSTISVRTMQEFFDGIARGEN